MTDFNGRYLKKDRLAKGCASQPSSTRRNLRLTLTELVFHRFTSSLASSFVTTKVQLVSVSFQLVSVSLKLALEGFSQFQPVSK
jgi:hypothetical protein